MSDSESDSATGTEHAVEVEIPEVVVSASTAGSSNPETTSTRKTNSKEKPDELTVTYFIIYY